MFLCVILDNQFCAPGSFHLLQPGISGDLVLALQGTTAAKRGFATPALR